MAVRHKIKYNPTKKHTLKNKSSFIVVVLKSLSCGVCICCGEPIKSLEHSSDHWKNKLAQSGIYQDKAITLPVVTGKEVKKSL